MSIEPTEDMLELHCMHNVYYSFSEFKSHLPALIDRGKLMPECERLIRTLGIMEPLTGRYIPPEEIDIKPPNYRESIEANHCLSRNRAELFVVEKIYGTLERVQTLDVYLTEAITGFSSWCRNNFQHSKLQMSEYVDQNSSLVGQPFHQQDICALTYSSSSFDLVVCNEVLEHVYDLEAALSELVRILRPGGKLLVTVPFAFGQMATIHKAKWNPELQQPELLCDPDIHGDPLRPDEGSLVYRIPGWEILEQLKDAGFQASAFHLISSWKFGILGGCDLPGVLVLEGSV